MQFSLFDLGLIDFKKALEVQKRIFRDVKSGSLSSALILCRHYPVITLGRSADRKNILAPVSILKDLGLEVYEVDRGGDVTYHGPGQFVLYPVLNLTYFKKDLHKVLRNLETMVLGVLEEFGVIGTRIDGLTGVWVGDKKIASIGIAVKNWITYHGVAINIKKGDMNNFSLIRPCGMDIMMTSLESFLGRKVDFSQVKQIVVRRWGNGQCNLA